MPRAREPDPPSVLELQGLQRLLDLLREKGHTVYGPVVQEGAVVLRPVTRLEQLPAGWTDAQAPGRCRLSRTTAPHLFGHTVGPDSWKRLLHPPDVLLWRAVRSNGSFRLEPAPAEAPRQAFLGVRACDLSALAILDRIMLEGPWKDPGYEARRRATVVLAVNCTRAGGVCFCASVGAGPRCAAGFDIALTELAGPDRHVFLAEAGSRRGRALLAALPRERATPEDVAAAEGMIQEAARAMGRQARTEGAREALYASLEHPHWDDLGRRCLSCANCTLVCPTCFCTTVDDSTSLSGTDAERRRLWDSCFNIDFSHIHGGSVRHTTGARCRHWITHKFASWVDQFGTLGCTGCGRCIAWCPAGIDITAELAAAAFGASPPQGGRPDEAQD